MNMLSTRIYQLTHLQKILWKDYLNKLYEKIIFLNLYKVMSAGSVKTFRPEYIPIAWSINITLVKYQHFRRLISK